MRTQVETQLEWFLLERLQALEESEWNATRKTLSGHPKT